MTNDEILMTNQCPSTNDQCRQGRGIFFVISHLGIDWSFVLCHWSFSPLEFELRHSSFNPSPP